VQTGNPHLKKAIELYKKWEPETSVSDVIWHCLNVGSVIIKENFVLVGERCWSDGFKCYFGTKNRNCWFVYILVGDKTYSVSEIMDEVIPAKYLAFNRRGSKKVKIYDFAKFKSKGI
jgi:hypothetical protein